MIGGDPMAEDALSIRRTALRLTIGCAALAVVPLLGGSMIWYAGDAERVREAEDHLSVNGVRAD